MPAISTPLSHFVQGSHSKQLAPVPQAWGTGANCQLLHKLASNPDCSFAGPLGGVGPVCGAEKFTNPIPIPARVFPKPDSFDYLNYPA